jgi:hypothetical protein
LAAREDDRYRLAATAEGGIWLLRTPHPDPVTALAGQRSRVDSTRQLTGSLRWNRAGTSRITSAPVADPNRARSLGVGQTAYLHRGGVTYIQIKQLVPGAVAQTTEWPAPAPPLHTQSAEPPSQPSEAMQPKVVSAADAGVSAFLDEAFGPERPR